MRSHDTGGFMPFAIAAIGGAAIGAIGSNRAAQTQAGAARQASAVELGMFNQTQQNLQPWMQGGQLALGELETLMGLGGRPGTQALGPGMGSGSFMSRVAGPTPGFNPIAGAPIQGGNPNDPNFGMLAHQFGLQDFQASPAYQFNLQEGQKAIDKAANARGNFYAPATLQDTARFSQGLASNEFQNAFQNYNTFQGNLFNRLSGLAGSGQNAAANLGGFGTTVGGQLGSNIIGAGNAQAAGQMGVANAVGGAFNQFGNQALWQQMLAQQQAPSTGFQVIGDPSALASEICR